MTEVRTTVEYLFGEKTLIKLLIYSNKTDDMFETNPITVILCYFPEMKVYGTLNRHPGFQQRHKMIQKEP